MSFLMTALFISTVLALAAVVASDNDSLGMV